MAHEEKRFSVIPLFLEPLKGFIADDVAGMSFVDFASLIVILPRFAFLFEQRIEIETLAGKHLVVVESNRFGVKVPFSYYRCFVSGLLELSRHVGLMVPVPIVVEGHEAILMAVLAAENRGSARSAN